MFRPRVIPMLLLHDRGLVKTKKFGRAVYLGDPINTVKIFNDKCVDEIIIADIDATARKRDPDFSYVEEIVSEAFMPVCYGGGVTRLDQMSRLFSLGVEKISVSAAAVEDWRWLGECAKRYGSQAIAVTLDVKKSFLGSAKHIVTNNARRNTGQKAQEIVKELENTGVGELIINDVDRDGMMIGYDLDYIRTITSIVSIPVVAVGGAGSLEDMKSVIEVGGAHAAAAGSLFVFYGKGKGVLINYPDQDRLKRLFEGEAHGS